MTGLQKSCHAFSGSSRLSYILLISTTGLNGSYLAEAVDIANGPLCLGHNMSPWYQNRSMLNLIRISFLLTTQLSHTEMMLVISCHTIVIMSTVRQ